MSLKALARTGALISLCVVGALASQTLEADIAKALGLRGPYALEIGHLGEGWNPTERWTFKTDKEAVSVVVKRFSAVDAAHAVKTFIQDIGAGFLAVPTDVHGRFEHALKMQRVFQESGLSSPPVVAAFLEQAVLVTRFIQGENMDRTVEQALDGDENAQAKLRRLGAALAQVHRRRICIGDFAPNNVLWADGEPVFIDLDHAVVDGPLGWDIAQFLYGMTLFQKFGNLGGLQRQWREVARTFLGGYLENGGDPAVIEQALQPEHAWRAHGPLANPEGITQISEELRSALNR